jgi:hypothetical protein
VAAWRVGLFIVVNPAQDVMSKQVQEQFELRDPGKRAEDARWRRP